MSLSRTVQRPQSNPLREKMLQAVAYQKAGEHEKAQRIYKSILKKDPKNVNALHLLGVTYRQMGFPKRAIEYIEKAIKLSPKPEASFLANLARAMSDIPDYSLTEILDTTEKALALNPKLLEALNLKGVALARDGREEEAEEQFQRLIVEYPTYVDSYRNYAVMLRDREEHEHALKLLKTAILLDPDNPENYADRARCRLALKEYDQLEIDLSEALERFPGNGDIQHEVARYMFMAGRHYEGLPYAQRAAQDNPNNEHRQVTLGVILHGLGRPHDALEAFGQAKRISGDKPSAADWNISLAFLATGDLEKGWDLHPARFLGKGVPGVIRRQFEQPVWRGEDISDKTILVWTDQGLGDTLMSGLMMPDLIKRAGHVIFEGPTKAIPLFERAFPSVTSRSPLVGEAPDYWPTVSDFDYHICISDLGRFFRRSLQAFDEADQSVYRVNMELARTFHERLGERTKGPIVGVCWRSQNLDISRVRSYLSAPEISPILEFEGVTYINLQYKYVEKEIAFLQNKTKGNFINFEEIDLFNDLDSALALSAICDVAIGPATASAVLPALADVPVLSFGGPPRMPLKDGRYKRYIRKTAHFTLELDQPTKAIVPTVKNELGQYLAGFSPAARLRRLGLQG
ncbi:hypothetical protein GCM10011316_12980 [Roseibium aquae]|uniref:Tetratricopeptide repeat protein n=1 Tax=Roseibium aquae TaxID=1323746 RepID=A0A916TEZ9_9HYPH|nr:tetratricopeptide repeat protein [Roseibium aquae]GGB42465.1 hypothetical protein GCM10011316_12980 [Roseibium aquae]